MNRRYTKADLEEIVYTQLENLNAVHDLLRIMKHQSELLDKVNKKLEEELIPIKDRIQPYPKGRRSSGKKA